MKILNRFILKSYLYPFARSFTVSLFILVLQFISRYKEELFGKGLEFSVLLKIFLYASASLIVLALPVSVLLSSLLCLGNFGENYELAAMRSSGVSLPRILRPMLIATILIAISSFLMSVYVVPKANLKLYSLLWDVKQVKPAFSLKPGHFNTSIDGYVIRIEDRDLDESMLYDVMIYDHTDGQGNTRVVMADSAKMIIDQEGEYMEMTLFKGTSYKANTMEIERGLRYSHVRLNFDTLFYPFDLKGFSMERTSEEAFSSHQYMLDINELLESIDSVKQIKDQITTFFVEEVDRHHKVDSSLLQKEPEILKDDLRGGNPLFMFPSRNRLRILQKTLREMETVQEKTQNAMEMLSEQDRAMRDFAIEYHGKYALPMACLLFLFIGAPLGAIIRKGGVGMPILVSVIFYMIFYVLMLQGRKMAREGVIEVWMGSWLPVLVLAPIALFLTFESNSTRNLLSGEALFQFLRSIIKFIRKINPVRLFKKRP